MGTVQKLTEEVKQGLHAALPTLRKTVVNKLAVGTMVEAQTPNTIERVNVPPVPTEWQDRRRQL